MRTIGQGSTYRIVLAARATLVAGGAIAGLLCSAPLNAQGNLPTTACRSAVTAAEPNKLPIVKANERFECLTEVAEKFQTAGQTVTQNFIPADPGCSTDQAGHPNATQITVTAYANAGNLDFEQDFKRKDGFVVAKIVNNTRCQTRGIKLKPGRTYFWVVENRGTGGRLVAVDDDIKLKFTSCGAQGFPGAGGPGGTVAMLKAKNADPKQGECDHSRTPDRGRLGSTGPIVGAKQTPMRFASSSTRRQESRGFVVWITCAQDCCYGEE